MARKYEYKLKRQIMTEQMDKKRIDSFWYHGYIAWIGYKDREVAIVVKGNIKVAFPEEDKDICNLDAVHSALNRNYTDIDLHFVDWKENNWFEPLYKKRKEKRWSNLIGLTALRYPEAIKMAEDLVKNDKFWKERYGK